MSSRTGSCLFRWDRGERMEQLEHCNLLRQKRAMKRMRTTLLRTGPDVGSSQIPISRHPDLRTAMSTSNADLVVLKRSKVRLGTAQKASRPPVQCRESRVSMTPKERTGTVQLRERSKNVSLSMSHDLASGSIRHPPGKVPTRICPGCNRKWDHTWSLPKLMKGVIVSG